VYSSIFVNLASSFGISFAALSTNTSSKPRYCATPHQLGCTPCVHCGSTSAARSTGRVAIAKVSLDAKGCCPLVASRVGGNDNLLALCYPVPSLFMHRYCLWVVFAVCFIALCRGGDQHHRQHHNAAIPVKRKLKGVFRLPVGSSLLNRLVRDVKASFCSELEGLTLLLTRPNDEATDLAVVDDMVTFVNTEYGDETIISNAIVKLSRKYAEGNPYTMLKSLLVLHLVANRATEAARRVVIKQYLNLRTQTDEKTEKLHFDQSLLKEGSRQASTAAELQAVRFVRHYAAFVHSYFVIRNLDVRTTQNEHDVVAALKKARKMGDKVMKVAKDVDAPLIAQCVAAVGSSVDGIDQQVVTSGRPHKHGKKQAAKETQGEEGGHEDGASEHGAG
jgi:hypothetical protein